MFYFSLEFNPSDQVYEFSAYHVTTSLTPSQTLNRVSFMLANKKAHVRVIPRNMCLAFIQPYVLSYKLIHKPKNDRQASPYIEVISDNMN